MTLRLGTLRGLDASATPRGTFTVLALDHRRNLRAELRPSDPESVAYEEMVDFKRAVVRALGDEASGVLLDPEVGVAQLIVDGSLPGRAGLIVAVEQTGYGGSGTARVSRLIDGWSVEQASRARADAIKLLVYYHPEAGTADHQERLVASVAEDCARADLPLFLEPLSYSIDPAVPKLTGDARRQVVVETARRLTRIGGDVLKAEFPYDAGTIDRARWQEACQELDEATAVPWVLLSGGVDEVTFEAQVEVACRVGASGVLVGRSVWAPSATMDPPERDHWLASEGRSRLGRLCRLVDELAKPWRERSTLASVPEPAEGWYRGYAD
jgi:tagatose-1,6-bisphosphate aldolase